MFTVYAVCFSDGDKHRHLLGTFADEMEAKHRANVATCSFAEYAYVKEFGVGTVFFIRRPDYESKTIDPLTLLKAQPAPQE